MSTPLLFNSATPTSARLQQPLGASPAQSIGTSSAQLQQQLSAPEALSRACKRLLDANTDLSLVRLQQELDALAQSVQSAFHQPRANFDGMCRCGAKQECSTNGRARGSLTDQLIRVRATLAALESHLRASGLGALELVDPQSSNQSAAPELDRLARDRQEEAKSSFERRKRIRDAASAVQGVLKTTATTG